MARRLSHISNKISAYLQSYYPKGIVGKIEITNSKAILSKPMQVAFLRGEALLIQHFFKYLEQKNINDLSSQQIIYTDLIEDKRHVQELATHCELLKFFNIKIDKQEDKPHGQACYIAYCITLFDAQNRKDQQVIQAMTTGFVIHFYPTLFPEKYQINNTKNLRKSLTTEIRKQWHLPVNIKESFTSEKDQVQFSLIAHVDKYHPKVLIKKQGKRLKPTRIKAYQEMLDNLTKAHYQLEMPKSKIIPSRNKSATPAGT